MLASHCNAGEIAELDEPGVKDGGPSLTRSP